MEEMKARKGIEGMKKQTIHRLNPFDRDHPFLAFLALLWCSAATAATAADPPKNLFEGGAFETWDEASGLPTATAWRWSLPKEPFAAMERSTAEAHAGAASLRLRDDSTARENQTLGHVVAKDELAKLRGKRVEITAWVKQVAASDPKVVGIGLWGRTEGGAKISAHDWTGTTLPTDWRPLRATAFVPEGATLLIVQLCCANGWGATGEAFFDDVALRVLPERDEAAAEPPASPEGAFRASFENQPAVVSDPWPRPTIERGCFWQDGRPVFLLGPWIYPRTHVDWKEGNPDPQGIGHRAYVEAPGRALFESMGFNASQLSSAWALPGQALYGLGLPGDWRESEKRIGAFFPRFEGQPMVVDFAFGFADALRKADPARARELEQQNGGWHQFLPFCPESPDGLRYYECYLKGGARAALRGGANVFVWELFNEPVYKCQCRGNAARFAERMEKRYGTIRRANAAWQTAFEDFADVARQTEFRQFPRLWPDYMAFLGERYAEVLETCKGFVREVDARPNVYFAEQSSTFTLTDARGAGMDYRLVADALDVLAYEGGIRFGHGAAKADAAEAEAAAFKSTVEHLFNLDFYRALARGAKPIVNDEHYCTRVEDGKRVPSRREDIVASLWTEVFHGSAGAFTYCWDKRSWEWKTLDEARRVAETPSYKSASLLNPWNYPPEALDGFAQFRDELEPLRGDVLPMPRTTPASVALFFSYPTLRMLDLDRIDYRARLLRWYGAVLGAHYPLRIVFEEDLLAGLPEEVKALVVPSARYATPESAAAVGRFVARGGAVVADADAFLRDERGDLLPEPPAGIVRLDADSPDSAPALLDALAASGARRDAVFERAGDSAASLCDIQVIDRGDLLLLLLVDLGAREPQAGLLKWNVGREGRFRISDAATGRAIPNGDAAVWTAADLARGIAVTVNPQERLLLRLDAAPQP